MLGQILGGRYAIERLLGEGAMGSVFEARHTGTGRRVAIKVITADLARNPAALARFEVEAKAAGTIDSEHVVAVLDAGLDEARGAPFMVMEALEGEDLDALLARAGALLPENAVRIALQALEGLEKAHARGIVHRDIKPSNIYLHDRGGGALTVKLLDFGVAKIMNSGRPKLTRTGAIIGSPLYMSPEQARSRGQLDHRTDLWSLGVVLYEMLAGRTPLHDIDALGELILAICSRPVPPLREQAPWVEPALAEAVERAIRMEPEERYPGAREMAAALSPFLKGASPELTKAMLARAGAPLSTGPQTIPIPGRPDAHAAHAAHEPAPTPAAHAPTPAAHAPNPAAHAPNPAAHAPNPAAHAPTTAVRAPTPAAHAPAAHAPAAHAPAAHAPTPANRTVPGEPVFAGATTAPVIAALPAQTSPAAPRSKGPWLALVGVLVAGALGAGVWALSRRGPTAGGEPPHHHAAGDALPSTGTLPPTGTLSPTGTLAPTGGSAADPGNPGQAAPGGLAALVGTWKSNTGRVYDAAARGDGIAFQIRDASQFPGQAYKDGEARFVLSAIPMQTGTFNVEDHERPPAPERTPYDADKARPSCLVTWTEVAGKPLTARLEGDRLTVKMAQVSAKVSNFVITAGKVTRCAGLGTARIAEVESLLVRQ